MYQLRLLKWLQRHPLLRLGSFPFQVAGKALSNHSERHGFKVFSAGDNQASNPSFQTPVNMTFTNLPKMTNSRLQTIKAQVQFKKAPILLLLFVQGFQGFIFKAKHKGFSVTSKPIELFFFFLKKQRTTTVHGAVKQATLYGSKSKGQILVVESIQNTKCFQVWQGHVPVLGMDRRRMKDYRKG